MQQHNEWLQVKTNGAGPFEITPRVEEIVGRSGVDDGICLVTVLHTSASLVIQENADPSARSDLQNFFERLAPEGHPAYTHTAEGADDMPSHIRAAMTRTSETLSVLEGRLVLGTWQGIYLWEHRRRGHRRRILVHVIGS